LLTLALVVISALLLIWSFLRRPADSDFLHGVSGEIGQALLVGAVLACGFALIGQQIEDESAARALQDDRRANEQLARTGTGTVFDGVDLEGAVLAGLDLAGTSFRFANLSDADVSGAELTDADLSSANLRGADLTGANLTLAELSEADLTNANLTDADLNSADLTRANLNAADLTGANLTGARLEQIACDDATVFPVEVEPPPQCSS
jgi:uncharacterized protein YjbI with pentapeptide repeats